MAIFCREVNQISPRAIQISKNFPREKPRTLAYRGGEGEGRGWEGIKGFIPLKEVQRERTREGARGMSGKGGEGPAARGDLAPRSEGGIDAPGFRKQC